MFKKTIAISNSCLLIHSLVLSIELLNEHRFSSFSKLGVLAENFFKYGYFHIRDGMTRQVEMFPSCLIKVTVFYIAPVVSKSFL